MGTTLVAASSMMESIDSQKITKTEKAKLVGKNWLLKQKKPVLILLCLTAMDIYTMEE